MDKWQAIDKFWNSFGIPAYDENTVVTGDNSPTPPYITYNAVTSRVGQEISLTASIWYRGYSWKEVSEKANEIAEAIGYGYKLEKVQPVDMFPHTVHVETVVLMSRIKEK